MMITVKDFGSNIEIFGSDYNFCVSGDDCREASYEENLDDVLERISSYEGRDLTAEEKEMIEDKIRTWLDSHSSDKVYIVVEGNRNDSGDIWNEDYTSLADAHRNANNSWNHLTDAEKKQKTVYILESANPDPDAPDHMDGNVIWEDGKDLDAAESTDNERVISEWQEAGGVLGYDTDRNGKTSLYIMDDGEFSDRCKEFTEDEDAVAKLLCESALRNAGISEEKIDQLMNWG